MYTITLEWNESLNTKRQEVSLNHIIDLGRHIYSTVVINDKSVARRQAIIFMDKNAIYLKCLDQKTGIQIGSGQVLHKGDMHALRIGSSFLCGTVNVRVVGLTHPSGRSKRLTQSLHKPSTHYIYAAA